MQRGAANSPPRLSPCLLTAGGDNRETDTPPVGISQLTDPSALRCGWVPPIMLGPNRPESVRRRTLKSLRSPRARACIKGSHPTPPTAPAADAPCPSFAPGPLSSLLIVRYAGNPVLLCHVPQPLTQRGTAQRLGWTIRAGRPVLGDPRPSPVATAPQAHSCDTPAGHEHGLPDSV